ncbi:MAG: S1 RNA-binding domain-containing protein, partial [Mariprofundaceae bacterium]
GLPLPRQGDEIGALVTDIGGDAIALSVLAARKNEAWEAVEQALAEGGTLHGRVVEAVKGGFRVNIDGLIAFMPRSEADPDPRMPAERLVGEACEVEVIEARRKPENVVVSRRRPLERVREAQRKAFFERAQVGDRVTGEVRRLTDFGAFVDIGGVDALLHVSDIAWQRLGHPSEMLSPGQVVTAEIVRLDPESGKVSISMKALQADPWEKVAATYEPGMRLTGTVRQLLDFGAVVELEPGIEGLIHRSELSWTRRDVRPDQVLSEGDVVDVQVLEVDPGKRRIRLSLKAVSENPWQAWLADHPVGSKVKGRIRTITDFGFFVAVSDELDGLVHMDNLSWEKPGAEALAGYQKGQEVECVVLGVDVERQRISLGVKQLTDDPFELFLASAKRGGAVNGRIREVKPQGAVVQLADGVEGWLPMREVPRDHGELKAGDEVETKVIDVDRRRRQVTLSIRRHLLDEEKAAIREYARKQHEDDTPSALALELQRKLLGKGGE